MDGLSKEEVFHLNEEIDRMDTSVFEFLAEMDAPMDEPVMDDSIAEDF